MNAPANITADDAFRAAHVGASEVAALFDASPWVTKFELWHRKVGNVSAPDFNQTDPDGNPENERVDWGIRLEGPIVDAACDRFSYRKLETPKQASNGKGLGGHPDQVVMCPRRGRTILEVKTVDWLQRKKWGDEPPLNYLLQTVAYMGLTDCLHGDVIVLVGGNALERHSYEFRPVLFTGIEARVSAFWDSVHAGQPPKPDYDRDRSTIAALFDDPVDTLIDLRLDNRATYACADYLAAAAEEKAAKGRKEAAAAELLDKLGPNVAAMVEGYSLRAPLVAAVPDREITPEMVGDIIKGRKAHRRISIKEKA